MCRAIDRAYISQPRYFIPSEIQSSRSERQTIFFASAACSLIPFKAGGSNSRLSRRRRMHVAASTCVHRRLANGNVTHVQRRPRQVRVDNSYRAMESTMPEVHPPCDQRSACALKMIELRCWMCSIRGRRAFHPSPCEGSTLKSTDCATLESSRQGNRVIHFYLVGRLSEAGYSGG